MSSSSQNTTGESSPVASASNQRKTIKDYNSITAYPEGKWETHADLRHCKAVNKNTCKEIINLSDVKEHRCYELYDSSELILSMDLIKKSTEKEIRQYLFFKKKIEEKKCYILLTVHNHDTGPQSITFDLEIALKRCDITAEMPEVKLFPGLKCKYFYVETSPDQIGVILPRVLTAVGSACQVLISAQMKEVVEGFFTGSSSIASLAVASSNTLEKDKAEMLKELDADIPLLKPSGP